MAQIPERTLSEETHLLITMEDLIGMSFGTDEQLCYDYSPDEVLASHLFATWRIGKLSDRMRYQLKRGKRLELVVNVINLKLIEKILIILASRLRLMEQRVEIRSDAAAADD